jgi:hypothetical protein
MPDEHDEDDVLFPRRLELVERLDDLVLRRFAGDPLRVDFRFFGKVDDVFDTDLLRGVHERPGPALKELGMFRFARQPDDHRHVRRRGLRVCRRRRRAYQCDE